MCHPNTNTSKRLRVINIGIQMFYDALLMQDAKVTQIEWQPPIKQSEEVKELIDKFL